MSDSYTAWAWPWWTVVVFINVLNITIALIIFKRTARQGSGQDTKYLKRMRVLGLIFTLVALYRSVFVSRYLLQMAWFDTVANSSLLIRILAITAEMAFSGLFAFSMLQLNKELPSEERRKSGLFSRLADKGPYILLTSIFLAQFFATGGLIMKSSLLFAIEETLWTVGFLSILPLAIKQLRRVYRIKDPELKEKLGMLRRSTVIVLGWTVFYCCYGLFYHLPLESWAGAIEQINTGMPIIKTGLPAIRDAFLIVNESKEYADWGFGFLLWHTGYFTLCVWIVLYLMKGPRMRSMISAHK